MNEDITITDPTVQDYIQMWVLNSAFRESSQALGVPIGAQALKQNLLLEHYSKKPRYDDMAQHRSF